MSMSGEKSCRELPILRLIIWALTIFALAGCHAKSNSTPKDVFHNKFKTIQIDMTEGEVDQILAGYPCVIREPTAPEREWGGHGKDLKRKASFVKTYDCKLGIKEGDFCMKVYFDEDYFVVDTVISQYTS